MRVCPPLFCAPFLGILFAVVSCRSSSASLKDEVDPALPIADGTAVWDYPFDQPVECGDGEEKMFFTVERLSDVERQDLALDGDIFIEPVDMTIGEPFEGQDEVDWGLTTYAVRFDVCVGSDDQISLHRVILRKDNSYSFGNSNPVFHILEPRDKTPSPVWQQATFNEDVREVNLLFDGGFSTSYWLKGWTSEQGSYLTINAVADLAQPQVVAHREGYESPVTVGKMVFGNPFEEFERPTIFNYRDASYEYRGREMAVGQFGSPQVTLELRVEYEVLLNPGGYRVYKFDQKGLFEIRDRHPSLAESTEILLEKDRMVEGMEVVETHHNLSDQFIVRKEGVATYTIFKGMEEEAHFEVKYDDSLNLPSFRVPITRVLAPQPAGSPAPNAPQQTLPPSQAPQGGMAPPSRGKRPSKGSY